MTCPICKKKVAMGAEDFPFCSERCKMIDLGKWSSEEYRIPVIGPNPMRSASSETAPEDDDEE